MITITVADSGIGIAPESMDLIFRLFEQEDQSERRRYEGLGLGLSISREVAVRHGGSLTVESVLGRGSTFFCRLPYRARRHHDVKAASIQETQKTDHEKDRDDRSDSPRSDHMSGSESYITPGLVSKEKPTDTSIVAVAAPPAPPAPVAAAADALSAKDWRELEELRA